MTENYDKIARIIDFVVVLLFISAPRALKVQNQDKPTGKDYQTATEYTKGNFASWNFPLPIDFHKKPLNRYRIG